MFVGLDIGSRAAKGIVRAEGQIRASHIMDTGGRPKDVAVTLFAKLLSLCNATREDISYIVGTGYGRVSMAFVDKTLTELSCHAAGAYSLNPAIRTVIDIGGQDSKVIRLDGDGNMLDFIMNDKCAAGTGRFIEVAAKALDVTLEDLAKISFIAKNPCEINSTCAVFAESEIISLLASDVDSADIASGLHRAFAHRVGTMAKKVGVVGDIAFVGGVAKNHGLATAICTYLDVEFSDLNFDPQLIGALGAAVIAERSFVPLSSTANY
ncbi:MAG: acyl-CoA dehydratase activase [Desulforhopalus sp.]